MNILLINLSLVCFVTFLMVVWFESDIITTVSNLTGTRKLFKMPNYEKYVLEQDAMCDYPTFLYLEYPNYLTKLLSCPICFCFWSTLVTTNIFVYNHCPFQTDFFIYFPINYILSLLTYLCIRKLI